MHKHSIGLWVKECLFTDHNTHTIIQEVFRRAACLSLNAVNLSSMFIFMEPIRFMNIYHGSSKVTQQEQQGLLANIKVITMATVESNYPSII